MIRRLRHLWSSARGSVAIETALTLPLLCLILLGGIELSRFILAHQKVERTSATLADLVARSDTLSNSGMDSLFAATQYVMAPFELGENGHAVITLVIGDNGTPKIAWQRYQPSDATGSEVGTIVGQTATLPTGFTIANGDHVIIAEVFYDYQPMFTGDLLSDTSLQRMAIFRPRFGTLTIVSD
jgi:Flp pilus assembly protein TadG